MPVPVRMLSYDDIESIEPTKPGKSPAMKVLIGVGTYTGLGKPQNPGYAAVTAP